MDPNETLTPEIQAVFSTGEGHEEHMAVLWDSGRFDMYVGGALVRTVECDDVDIACRRALRWTGLNKASGFLRQLATGRGSRW
jgi:hypothetical protein